MRRSGRAHLLLWALPFEASLLFLLLLRFAVANSSPESAPPPSPQQPPPVAPPPAAPSPARPGGRVASAASIRPDSTGSLSPRTVTTRYGELRGVVWAPDGRHSGAVEAFLGVPYASPPTGSLRFMPPVSGAVWRGVRLADRPGPACPQRFPEDVAAVARAMEAAPNPPSPADEEIIRKMPKGRVEGLKRLLPHLRRQSEDCLFLNIYTPGIS
ncbi:hypothetical protein J437_LFUL000994 [Ladona fulva]|uniref:Carboxylesterase type B domain-containing protein n=1 Tax=Ladona fulva TaxID=123851 RepID=A0A8K0P629_LADFU|nr:hypothetical protein J437_LFUL000994 [Ladona fulva]